MTSTRRSRKGVAEISAAHSAAGSTRGGPGNPGSGSPAPGGAGGSGAGAAPPPGGSVSALAEALRQAIVSGELAPGARLTEAALESAFETDAALLGEALMQLESRGLVVREPRRYWRVRGFDAGGVRQLYAVRALLERQAMAGLAEAMAEDPDPATLDRLVAELSAANATMEKRRAAGDAAGYLKANERFHAVVLRHAPNEPLRLVLELLNDMAAPLRAARLSERLGQSNAVEEHAAIIEMLGAGQIDAAVDAMQDHVLGNTEAAVAANG